MTVHGNVELLSSFVDGELETAEREAVESHLAECPPCRERLVGLRRVVNELQDLVAVTPPRDLSGHVHRAVRLDAHRGGVLRGSAASLVRWTQQPLLLPLFGVITALAILLYLFTAWSDRLAQPGTQLIVAPQAGAPSTAVEGDTVRLAGRTFDRRADRWVERGADAESVGEPIDLRRPDPAYAAFEPLRSLGGRVILLDGGRPVAVDFGAP